MEISILATSGTGSKLYFFWHLNYFLAPVSQANRIGCISVRRQISEVPQRVYEQHKRDEDESLKRIKENVLYWYAKQDVHTDEIVLKEKLSVSCFFSVLLITLL